MKKFSLLTLVTILLFSGIGYFYSRSIRTARAGSNKSFTVKFLVSGTSLVNPQNFGSFTHVIAQRADGAVARIDDPDSDNPKVSITYPVAKKHVLIRKKSGLIATLWLYPSESSSKSLPPPFDPTCNSSVKDSDGQWNVVGTGEILGFPVVNKRVESEYAIIETSEAPDCGCLELSRRTLTKNGLGGFASVTTETAMVVRLGEPESELFEIPRNLDEVSPSEIRKADGGNPNLPSVRKRDLQWGANWQKHTTDSK